MFWIDEDMLLVFVAVLHFERRLKWNMDQTRGLDHHLTWFVNMDIDESLSKQGY